MTWPAHLKQKQKHIPSMHIMFGLGVAAETKPATAMVPSNATAGAIFIILSKPAIFWSHETFQLSTF
ncbi:hypothetical protein Pogu_1218 [Pyrobaculum oguniense TE7]|uniref:Uncharacterized protein n=1 Tax=Pyrobaculum oguniense (strain DSM 13380 / JCM 10595 / TE7) TaxID=698757 RepID=H6Q8U0_PYROT|nr:hypothetical protein Pogu_1218 [Pyrobaculum oguniense TE7]